ncbi:mCG1034303, partial [Mus musculus]
MQGKNVEKGAPKRGCTERRKDSGLCLFKRVAILFTLKLRTVPFPPPSPVPAVLAAFGAGSRGLGLGTPREPPVQGRSRGR